MGARTRLASAIGGLMLLVAACLPGTPDLGFSPTGNVPYAATSDSGGLVQLVARPDGSVVGTRGAAQPLTRITAEGVVDATWGASLPDDCRRTSRTVASGPGVLFTCSHLAPPSGPEVWQVCGSPRRVSRIPRSVAATVSSTSRRT